ncbi:hypothetical protein Tco_1036129, partial [Tanacetum coccineum]
MILNSVQNGPLVWPTVVEEDGTTRTKKYEKLSVAEKLQADYDLKAINIIFQGLPPDLYAIVSLDVPMFTQGYNPIACLNKAMAFLTAVASSRFPSTNNQVRTFSNLRNQATIQDGKPKRPRNAAWFKEKAMLAEAHDPTEDLDAYDSDCNDVSNAKAVLMANLSIYGSDIIKVTHEKMIDSQMDDMIKEKLALKQQIDSLEQNLSNQIKEKESLLETFT